MTNRQKVEIEIPGRESLVLDVKIDESHQVKLCQLTGIGGISYLRRLDEWRSKICGPIAQLEAPQENDLASLLLREAILKIQGLWGPPYKELILCHCRSIATEDVDRSILLGANRVEQVKQQTSASTACGTCQPDIEAMIDYRLKLAS